MVDEGAKAEAAPPGGGHVDNVDALVALRDDLAPLLQGLGALQRHFGCHGHHCCDPPPSGIRTIAIVTHHEVRNGMMEIASMASPPTIDDAFHHSPLLAEAAVI